MSREETLMALRQQGSKVWRNYLPFPLELEWCACPICSKCEAYNLMRFDQFGFPIGTVECQECGFVYTNPRPTENYMNAFYEKYFWFFFQGHYRINEVFLRRQRTREWAALRFARWAPYLSGANSILEIGCGPGLFLDQVRQNFPAIMTAGIEPDPKMAKYCRKELALDVHQGFFRSHKSDSRFDVIALFHVIEHLFDFTSLFQFIRKHITPSGLVIMEAPNVDGGWRTISMIQLSHLHIFSPRTIKNLFIKNGFEALQVRTLENDLDESNLSVVGRIAQVSAENLTMRNAMESARIRSRFQHMPTVRVLRIIRAWIRLAYFAVRR
jgi:SAM-dependent methyltransferase